MTIALPALDMGCDDEGAGQAILFVHGFPLDRSLWRHQRVALSTRCRCLVPDLRGFGESSVRAPFSVDQYADDLALLMDRLEIDDAIVCGLSMGGYIAMAMWRRHADRIRGLVLCDTKASADSEAARGKREEMIAVATAEGSGAVASRQIGAVLGASTRARHPEIEAEVLAMMSRQPVGGVVGALGALRDRPDSRSTLSSISVPTLVIVGEEDTVTPVADAEEMMALLPAVARPRLERIANAGHLSCLERPAAVTHAIAEFVATV